ncbi:uncharacterized protein LOC131842859 [Achroia grisella]|uniref:uncharacterized protein LOC131842859 n=1 Tax=Achroia grisella TaxID=688607 RepID=UPI0027D2AB6A|nr:uncharacterized protein LOC131842859 [Achroia grisella]
MAMVSSDRVRVCRLCLVVDVRMTGIDSTMENSMKALLGKDITSTDSLPRHLCFECAAYVRKFQKFRDKCLIAQSILCTLLKSNKNITDQEIRAIDRKMLKLESQLSHMNIPVEESHTEMLTIKIEPYSPDMSVKENDRMMAEEDTAGDHSEALLRSQDVDDFSLKSVNNKKRKRPPRKRKSNKVENLGEKNIITDNVLPIEQCDHSAMLEGYPVANITMQPLNENTKGVTNKQQTALSRAQEKAKARKRKFLDKMTPEQKALKKKKDLQYYHKKKAEKKKHISELPENQRVKLRELWRINSKKYRERKKKVEVEVIIPDIKTEFPPPVITDIETPEMNQEIHITAIKTETEYPVLVRPIEIPQIKKEFIVIPEIKKEVEFSD